MVGKKCSLAYNWQLHHFVKMSLSAKLFSISQYDIIVYGEWWIRSSDPIIKFARNGKLTRSYWPHFAFESPKFTSKSKKNPTFVL